MLSHQERAEWLAQVIEEPLDPTLRICDPHHHLWQRPDSRYMVEELCDDAANLNIESSVFVECGANYRAEGLERERSLGETEWVRELAVASAARRRKVGQGPVIKGIVGYVDLRLGAAVKTLVEQHQRLAGGLLRGIRHSASWDPHPEVPNSHSGAPPDLYLDPAFRAGVAQLAELGLVCETWQYHHQLTRCATAEAEPAAGLSGLARALPEVTFVMDHCGGPVLSGPYADRKDGVFDDWRRAVDEVAACENVVVKLGGIAMPRNGFGWHLRDSPPDSLGLASAQAPWIKHCLASFGEDRAMFASNFPVDKISCSYTVLWNSFLRTVEDRPTSVHRKLFQGNASRIYSL